ncbi:DUF6444 domain-containing protein [Sphaerotilus sp.]|uniref:DUF6444 domain-containing protein n=1 Tax=Sphaerotilus sp. TaxID=2093942 RepID=UPI002ACE1247|nr:DUF6444 domain-containing protein [Sphaerotilus sp.]MDZ7858445.1 DUF6444 domain-containing protein [Sphaerotilus sp.]
MGTLDEQDIAAWALERCHAVIEQMGQELAKLHEQVSALLDKKLNSRNSPKPPSSDGPGSGGNRARRRASGRAPGVRRAGAGASRGAGVPEGFGRLYRGGNGHGRST